MMKRAAAALCASFALAAAAQTPSTEEAAKRALAAADFEKVIATYAQDVATGSRLSGIAHYRLAIAHQRLGHATLAFDHLGAALKADPSGSFATSPARLEQLVNSIAEACGKFPAGCGKETAASTTAPAVAIDAKPPAAVATAPGVSPIAAAPSAPEAPPQPAALAVAAPPAATPPRPAPAPAEPPRRSMLGELATSTHPGFLLAVGWVPLSLLYIAWLRRPRVPSAVASLEDLRARSERLVETLGSSHIGRQTEVYQALTGLVPLIEREIGRSVWRSGKGMKHLVPADRRVLENVGHLSKKPVDVMTATAEDVRRMFQRPVL